MLVVVVKHYFRHIHLFITNRHFMWLIPTGAQDCSAKREDAGERFCIQPDNAVFHQTPKTITKAYKLYIR